jgi:hypothetical protein
MYPAAAISPVENTRRKKRKSKTFSLEISITAVKYCDMARINRFHARVNRRNDKINLENGLFFIVVTTKVFKRC